jgi:hypothetical protein
MSSHAESMAETSNPEREFLRVSALLMEKGVDLHEVYPTRFCQILGKTGGGATVYFIGQNGFSNPVLLLERLKVLFGGGTSTLLLELIDRANEQLGGGS